MRELTMPLKEKGVSNRDIPGVVNPAGERETLPKPEQPFKGRIGQTVKRFNSRLFR